MKYRLVFLLLSILFLLIIKPIYAQDYTIDGSVVPAISSQDLTPVVTPKPTLHGLFTGKNYSIQVGFEDFDSERPFFFSVSENMIDYGQLLATDPVTRVNTLSISAATTLGFTVQAFEDHALISATGSFIPDTKCDNGICNDIVSQPWNGTLTYGFGYRCDPSTSLGASLNPCVSSFLEPTSYRHFPKEAEPQIIIDAIKDSSAQISYKINISGSQATELYNNSVTFIAVPNF